ncbi:hypothetical protein FOYG_17568 [Fusarium oxysporum NRRL 32931]|uniref:Uncharacterized protein n=1 Tax=Fusarium oxysporum NRRL 32931 TaxID=660029 RepID=W9HGD7_FUSOX|nr:hypothetical protein FOYG_17568 [Fusarium oxysporum NRRL 32931]
MTNTCDSATKTSSRPSRCRTSQSRPAAAQQM